MKKNILLRLFLSIVLSTLIAGCATTSDVKEAPAAEEDKAVITNLQIQDNKLVITGNRPFTYIIYSTEDPYKTTVEIPDMTAGNFKNKIVSDRAGFTEIIPQQIDLPKPLLKIDIILQSPSGVIPIYEDSTLTLITRAEEPFVKTEKPVVVSDEGYASDDMPISKSDLSSLRKATEITSIELEMTADALQVLIRGNGSMTPNVFPINGRIVVDIPGVSMNAQIPKRAILPLKGIRAGKHKDKVRFVLDLEEETKFDVIAIGSSIVISLEGNGRGVVAARVTLPAKGSVAPEGTGTPEGTGREMNSAPELVEGIYSGKRISLDFQDADIIPIFRLLADISGYNIVIHHDVKGRITLKLKDVPWDQALDLMLRTFSLSKVVEGNIIRIVPTKVFTKELKAISNAKKARAEVGELKTRIFPVNYADLNKLKDAIDKAKILSSKGSITLDERGSSLIVNDIDANLEKVRALIKEIDREHMQARQVMIKVKIVEVNTDYTKELGIQWGSSRTIARAGDTTTIGGVSQAAGTGFSGNNFLVNLPAAIGSGAGGAIGFGYISKAANFALDLQLSALETKEKLKVLSNPRIMTMNNEEATITQGTTIYLGVATADKISYQAINALLSLKVKPRIAPGGAILMKLDIKKDEPGGVTEGGINISRNSLKTTVLINSGDTVVIGGIFKTKTTRKDDSVPGLSTIPILGLLFKKKQDIEENKELLIFISPTIVEFSSLR